MSSVQSTSNNSQMTRQSYNSGDSNSNQSEYTYYDSAFLESQHGYDNSSGTSQPYIENNNNNNNNIEYVIPPIPPVGGLNLLNLHEQQPEVGGHMDVMHDIDNDDDSMLDPAEFIGIDVDNPNNGNNNEDQLDIESNHSNPHLDIPWGVNDSLRTQRDEDYLRSIN